MTIKKTITISVCFMFCSIVSVAQTKEQKKHLEGIEKSKKTGLGFISMDTVYIAGNPLFYCNTSTKEIPGSINGGWIFYDIFNFGSKDTLMSIQKLGDPMFKQYAFIFPQIKYRFEAGNSWSEGKIIKALREENVFSKGKVSIDALKSFGNKNNITIMTFDEYNQFLQQYDALQKANEDAKKTQESIANIKNNSYKTVNLEIRYPGEKYVVISIPQGGIYSLNQNDKKGQICIVGGMCEELPIKYYKSKGNFFIYKNGTALGYVDGL